MPKLGVNIDHVATLRQARGETYPSPIEAAKICEKARCDSIVVHLREDRRHINDLDVKKLRETVKTRLNLEMSLNEDIVKIAAKIRPDQATLVPEKRQEITTEGGLDVIKNFNRIKRVNHILSKKKITVSLFIDPVKKQIDKTRDAGIDMIELHTGTYANAKTKSARDRELQKIKTMTRYARKIGLTVNAGHGLTYKNTPAIARIPGMEELNIGHFIIAQSVFEGLDQVVKKMRKLCKSK